jgi:hypothetical protein
MGPMPPYQYVIDTSAFIDLKNNYRRNTFPGLWQNFEAMCADKLIISPREVFREIKKGDDILTEWVADFEDMFLEPCEQEVTILQAIYKEYPKEIIAKYGYGNWADPLVLACGKHYNITIIQEERNERNPFVIPRIAKKFNIKYTRLSDFFEDQAWEFH